MNPPIVYEVTKPRSQRTINTTAMVQSIFHHLLPCASDVPSTRAPQMSPKRRSPIFLWNNYILFLSDGLGNR